ncbi:response regulator [Paraburkholderia antibiotica]|uniref:Response regulator transcription factor n=1 Tax=Paraburkholderia antibiotica TaxID=2728839 RepID=A0A7X9X7F3_9BURK|nr:response regulator transcription factor [Paraburkholderia antibiotica]NML32718.1 response regulator transcription factor [Paraburkholderia antibiotica]
MKIDLMLADDHPAVLSGMKYAINSAGILNIVGVAQDSNATFQLLDHVHCDVLVTDYFMPGGPQGEGLALLSDLRLRYPALRIVVFTSMDNPAIVREIAKIGIQSVVSKSGRLDHLISAIHAVYAGSTYFPGTESGQDSVFTRFSSEKSNKRTLSPREEEVVRLYVSGLSSGEISRQLNVTKQTVSTQKSSAMQKLGITRDADLFRFAFEIGLSG